MTKKTVIYLAGPMTGINHFNAERFFDIEESLREHGFDVFNPAQHDIETGFDPYKWDGTEPLDVTGFDLEGALAWDLARVAEADIVVVLPYPHYGWKSTGVDKEVTAAMKAGIPVMRLVASDIDRYSLGEMLHPSTIKAIKNLVQRKTYTLTEQANRFQWNPETESYEENPNGNAVLSNEQAAKVRQNSPGGVIPWSNDALKTFIDSKSPKIPNFEGDCTGFKPELPDERTTTNRWTGDEVRTVSSTGGQKGVKGSRYSLLPVDALKQIAEHYGKGAAKYDSHQWRKGYEWSKSFDALMRHAQQFWSGEDFDEETGSNHMAAVAWHALTLLTFYDEHPEFDDRYKGE